jgi:RHS repeat-associated protein
MNKRMNNVNSKQGVALAVAILLLAAGMAAGALTADASTGSGKNTGSADAPPASPSPTSCPIQFTDVSPSTSFYPFVHDLACRGVISGYVCGGPGEPCDPHNDPYFRPANSVTRGQLTKITGIAASFDEAVPASQQTFADVSSANPFWAYIERLSSRSIIGGYACGGPGEPCDPQHRPYFRPGNSVTRGQLAKIDANAANLDEPLPTSQQTFADVPYTSPFWAYVERISLRGIIGGYQCGGVSEPCDSQHRPYFRPANSVTRGQISKIVDTTALGGPASDELLGGVNRVEGQTVYLYPDFSAKDSAPAQANPSTGNLWLEKTFFNWPERMGDNGKPGESMELVGTYNSRAAGSLSTCGSCPLGYGWTHTFNMWIDGPANPIVHQENGSIVPFLGSGPAYTHDSRVLAELFRNPDGSYVFTRTQGQTHFFFTAQGKLDHIVDRNGYATTLTYDANGRLQVATDPVGRTLTFTYDTNGRLITTHDHANRNVTFQYDASGRLVQVTDVAGNSTNYGYDTSNRLMSLTDPIGNSYTYVYDAQGRHVRQTDPLGHSTQYAYTLNLLDSTATITHPLGNQTVHTYQANRLIRMEEDEASYSFTWGAGYQSGLASVTDPDNHTWLYNWDSQGNLLSATDPSGSITHYTYNATNDLLSRNNALGVPTTYTYDANGNLITSARTLTQTSETALDRFTYDPAHPGDVLTWIDSLKHEWNMTYDPFGYRTGLTNPLGQTTHYTYDNLGRLVRVTTPAGSTAAYTYSANGNLVSATDPMGSVTSFAYDANDNLISRTDANGHATTYTYDATGNLVRVTRADSTHTDYGYDANGRLISQANGLGQTTHYTYDNLGRLIRAIDPLNRSTTYAYDPAGNLVIMTDALGLSRAYAYDPVGRLTGINYSDGSTPNVTYQYDSLGRRISMSDGTGISLYAYDSLNRLTGERNGAGQGIGYGYDLNSNLISLAYPGTGPVTRTYDSADRLVALHDWLNHSTGFTYDPDGNLTGIVYPNGTLAAYSYNADGQVSAITHSHNSTPFLSFTYGRDPLGLLTSAGEGTTMHSYGYDPLNRLIGEAIGGSGPQTPEAPEVVNRIWNYDGAYEITQTSSRTDGGIPTTSTRMYDAANELSGWMEMQGQQPLHQVAFTYDVRGNRIHQVDAITGQQATYSYDGANRPISFNRGQGQTTYRYDGDGLRASKQGTQSANFTWDSSQDLPLLLQDGIARYIYGPNGMLVEEVTVNGSQSYFYHADQLGSVRALTNQSGAVANAYTYDAYGSLIAAAGSAPNPFGYAGEYTDAESDLVYMRARYYDPAIQQFLTRDPLVDLTGQAYAYACDTPLNCSDPSGLDPKQGQQGNVEARFQQGKAAAPGLFRSLKKLARKIPVIGWFMSAELEAGAVCTEKAIVITERNAKKQKEAIDAFDDIIGR